MYSVLFIGKGTITKELSKGLINSNFECEFFRPSYNNISEIDISYFDYVVCCSPSAETSIIFWESILTHCKLKDSCDTKFVDISTLTTSAVKHIHKKFIEKNIVFIEAPFTGSKTGARNLSLIYFAYSKTIKASEDIFLKTTSSKIYVFDKIGSATKFKLFYNLWGLTLLGVYSQMINLLEYIPQKKLALDIIKSNSDFWMSSITNQKIQQTLASDYSDIHCKLKYAKKDILYATDEFRDQNTIISKTLLSILNTTLSSEYDNLDFTSMVEFFRHDSKTSDT